MPLLEKTPETLRTLIAKAINEDPVIANGMRRLQDEQSDVEDEIVAEIDSIWEVTLEEGRRYAAVERDLNEAIARVASDAGEHPADARVRPASETLFVGLVGLNMIVIMVWAGYNLVTDWRGSLASLATLRGWLIIAAAFAPLVAIGMVAAAIESRRDEARKRVLAERTAKWDKLRADLNAKYGTEKAQAELDALGQTIETLLFERVRLATIAAINRHTDPSYATRLVVRRPRGFGEVFDRRFSIDTPARKRLQFMLSSMPGGSIGIAGSRGAGKTTLLKLFCGPKRVVEKINDKPVLGVLVSAPVAYQARDFILYLFSAICQNVIEAEGGKYQMPVVPAESPANLQHAPALRALRPLAELAIGAGVLLLLASLAIGAILAGLQSTRTSAAAPEARVASESAASAVPAQSAPTAAQPPAVDKSAKPMPATPAPQAGSPAATRGGSFAALWASQMKINPGTLFAWGVSLLIAGLVMAEVIAMGAARTLLVTLARLIAAPTRVIPLYGRRAGKTLDAYIAEARASWESDRLKMPDPTAAASAGESLQAHAETWLKVMKFQQSYTSGWSGALKLPLGLEGGVSRAVTLAQNQLSLPEVVYLLTRFLEEVSVKYQLIIGIDEMDKLATDDLAQQFLNDIKSIFGLERCFYLISVSENAMSNFERRGLPFRDVFDSAFDDFVYVDHLSFASARELLEQRVVGRPIPFFAMSYCMSGGLARDLIRNFRSILEVYDENNPANNGLSDLCRTVVQTDLKAKIRATITSAKKIKFQPELDTLLEALHKLEVSVSADSSLVDAADTLFKFAQEPAANRTKMLRSRLRNPPVPPSAEDKERAARVHELRELAQELATYIQYAITLRDVFNDALTEATLEHPPKDGEIVVLAKARQLLGVNPALTRAMLKTFRDARGLQPFAQVA